MKSTAQKAAKVRMRPEETLSGPEDTLSGPEDTQQEGSPTQGLCARMPVRNVASRFRWDTQAPLREIKASIRVKCIEG